MLSVIIIALAQTGLLLLVCVLLWEWGAKLNRKLHRIESNTRHAASGAAPEDESKGQGKRT